MNRPLAIGLIIFFILVIAAGAVWLAVRPAPEAPEPERGFLQRFPFGDIFEREAEETPPTEAREEAAEGRTTLISGNPVAGFTVIEGEPNSKVRWIERQTGHVFESGPKAENITRVSNTTIPKIFDVDWSPDGQKAILKYTEEGGVRVVSAEFVATSTRGMLLPAGILDTAYAPNRERVLYSMPAGSGIRLIAANHDNTEQNEVLASPFRDWSVGWPTPNTISFLSRPSGETQGFLFRYDVGSGDFSKVLGEIAGLETLWSPEGRQIIFSAFDENTRRPKLSLYNVASRETTDLNITTLVSKCAFGQTSQNIIYCGIDANLPLGLYPDDKLQGKISTDDTLWKINLESGEKNILSDEMPVDVGEIKAGPDDKFLYFTNQTDNSLWSVEIEN